MVAGFKSACGQTHQRNSRGTPGASVWQRNYYEHVIRYEAVLDRHPPIHCREPGPMG